jgi:hypothetical protein
MAKKDVSFAALDGDGSFPELSKAHLRLSATPYDQMNDREKFMDRN